VTAILGTMTRHQLEVRGDFVDRIRTSPSKALAELIWNSLDADATDVAVTFERIPLLGGLQAIQVADNGLGMTHEQAVAGFGSLGGSWKDIEKQSRKHKRQLHGKQGRGRLLAFSIGGNQVRWRTVAEFEGARQATTITVTTDDRMHFDVSDPQPTTDEIGTEVRVEGITDNPRGIDGDLAWLGMVTEFALYIEQYKPRIVVDGRWLDPGPLQDSRHEYEFDGFDAVEPPKLTIVEWKIDVPQVMYLCGPAGVALDFVKAPRPPSSFDYTAYLSWHGIEERSADLALVETGQHPVLSPIVETARKQISAHFAERQREQAKTVIEEWRDEEVYPYVEPPKSVIEEATRNLFDFVAVAAAPAVNASEDKQSRRLALALLRQAVEREPTAVEEILQEVLQLPAAEIEDFRHLLRRASLASIIKASRGITDRLDFLSALRILVFDPKTKAQVRERDQLHRILENETWIFGEEFSLTASDQGLTAVLKAHIKILGREALAPEDDGEVLDPKGKRRRLDLMLARSVPHARQEHEHLVVELKAPKVVIGDTEITQIKTYARMVARDPRFERLKVRWDFVIVSTDLDENAKADANQANRPPGLVSDQDGIRVWAKSWAEIIDDADWRLNFVKERLRYTPTDELALDYLRRVHEPFLPETLRETGPSDAALE
jgi:hypothetical protein